MKIRQGRIPTGKGMFLWMLFRLLDKSGAWPAGLSDMAKLADQLAAEGYNWVCIKVVHGRYIFDPFFGNDSIPSQQEYLEALAPELERVGIELHLWGYYFGSRPIYAPQKKNKPKTISTYFDQTSQEIARTLEQIEKWKPLSFMVNAEAEFKWPKSDKRAESLMMGIKQGMALTNNSIPDIPLGLSSFKYPKFHPLPWETFAKFIDFWAPQVYWVGWHNAVEQLEKSIAQYKAIKDIPIIPAGSAYPQTNIKDRITGQGWRPAIEDFDRFDAAVQELGLLGIHYWEYHYIEDNPNWQKAIAAHSWSEMPDPPDPTDPPEPEPEVEIEAEIAVLISGIPYKSQRDADANVFVNDCGPSAVAMVLEALGLDVTTDEVYRKTGAPANKYVSITQMIRAAKAYGIQFEYFFPWTLDQLKQSVADGLAPIALVHYGAWSKIKPGKSTQSPFTGPHFVVVVGYDDEHIYVNDPLWWGSRRDEGEHKRWTNAEFEKAWSTANLDSNRNYSGIFCTVPLPTTVLGEDTTPTFPMPPFGESDKYAEGINNNRDSINYLAVNKKDRNP